eukprot:1133671-Pelagomonas_calceolata.AAC.3
MEDGGKQGRLSRMYGFLGYVGSADAQMPHGPPLGAFDDEDSSEDEVEGGEEEEEEPGVQDTAAAGGTGGAGGMDGLAVTDQGSKGEQDSESDEEEEERKEARASLVRGQKGRGERVESGSRQGNIGGQMDGDQEQVVAEGKGSAAEEERDEGDNEEDEEEEEEEEEEETFEIVEDEDDDDTGEEWESQDGKPPEVEITITVEEEGDKGKGDCYNCEVRPVGCCTWCCIFTLGTLLYVLWPGYNGHNNVCVCSACCCVAVPRPARVCCVHCTPNTRFAAGAPPVAVVVLTGKDSTPKIAS